MSRDFRPLILAELDVLRTVSITETSGTFKARSYDAAIKLIEALPAIRVPTDVPTSGIGKDMRARILQIITTGAPLTIDPATREKATAMKIFSGIYGVGPKKAQELLAAGYRTLEGIRAAVTSTKLKLNKNQLVGLKYYEDINSRIPRAEMDAHSATLMAALPKGLQGVLVGSYRRGRPDSGDIDILVTGDTGLAAFVTALKARGYLREVLAQGDHKCLAVVALTKARRLDILVTPPAEFPFAIFYFTGCDTFNVRVRGHALERGYSLNEHALTHGATGVAVEGLTSEEAIFAFLGLKFVPPHERTSDAAVIPLP